MKAVSGTDVDPGHIFNSGAQPLLPAEPVIFGSGVDNLYLLFKMQTPTGIASTPIVFGAKVRWV
jgi:hypothetical protein